MIVGTAGHVDHGKTSLVRALTGIDTDRLKEEKTRGITIDLGFAYMPGRDGDSIGFVDVPGHERLVRTMVAGAAGIDFVLLVVAGDEGIMPQTREHLAILDLLALRHGLAVVTKCDRIDAERRTAVTADIMAALAGTGLSGAAVHFVSAQTGEGIVGLRHFLCDAAASFVPRDAAGAFRLSVDRGFTLTGVGTIATGTVRAGFVRVGDEVTVLPSGLAARVRSLHAQSRQAEEGRAGMRCALALSGPGIGTEIVPRGAWICGGARPRETARLDAKVRLLDGAVTGLKPWSPVHFHCGASEIMARVTSLVSGTLPAGRDGLLQIVLDRPLPLRHGDRFILRDASAQHTIGGGTVIDPRAPARRRRGPERMTRLEALSCERSKDALVRLVSLDPGFEDLDAFVVDRGLAANAAQTFQRDLELDSLRVGPSVFVHTEGRWRALVGAITALLADFHTDNPEWPGLAGETMRLQLRPVLPRPVFAAVGDRLVAERVIAMHGHWLKLPGHVAQLSNDDRRLAALMAPLIARARFRPPRVRDLGIELAVPETTIRQTCKALSRTGDMIEMAKDHFFLRETVLEMADIALDLSRRSATQHFTAADFRDRMDSGRKVAIQILECFDRRGLTVRQGDLRRVVSPPAMIFGQTETPADL